MSILARRQPEPMPDPEPVDPATTRKIAAAMADDLGAYADSGGDVGLWPSGGKWTDPKSDWYIPPAVRRFYRRDADDDRLVIEAMQQQYREQSRLMPVARITREEVERVTHRQAVRRAEALLAQADNKAREARLDATLRRCEQCGAEGDLSVRPRSAPGWVLTRPAAGIGELTMPYAVRACDGCVAVQEQRLDALRAKLAAGLADEDTPAGPRGAAVDAWIGTHQAKLTLIGRSTPMSVTTVDTPGRIVDLLAVPYNEMSFMTPNPAGERVVLGAFAAACRDPKKVLLFRGHDHQHPIGRAIALWEADDGLHRNLPGPGEPCSATRLWPTSTTASCPCGMGSDRSGRPRQRRGGSRLRG